MLSPHGLVFLFLSCLCVSVCLCVPPPSCLYPPSQSSPMCLLLLHLFFDFSCLVSPVPVPSCLPGVTCCRPCVCAALRRACCVRTSVCACLRAYVCVCLPVCV